MKNIFNKMMIIFMVVLTCTTVFNTRVIKADETKNSSDLKDFISEAIIKENNTVISGSDKTPTMYVDQTYGFKLKFSEIAENKEGARQMTMSDEGATLTYDLPNNLDAVTESGTIKIDFVQGTDHTEVNGSFNIDKNNSKMTVTISKDASNFDKLKNASDVYFYVEFDAKIKSESTSSEIDFGNNIKQKITTSSTGSLELSKTAYYNKQDGKLYYTITVKSTGYSKNVVVTDTISGSVLTYDSNTFNASSNLTNNTLSSATTDSSDSKPSNGFKYTIPAISDGETITITYSANVDYSKLGNNVSFDSNTAKNGVTAKGDNTGDEVKEEYICTDKAYTVVSKKGETTETSDNDQTINWTITINEDCKVSMGGKTISDTLTSIANVTTKYSGDGITLTKYNKDGNEVSGSKQTINWSTLTNYTENSGWTYTLPNDTEAYKYVITYTTSTDKSNLSTNTNVSNTATVKNNEKTLDTANGSVTIGPSDSANFTVSKTHDASTLKESNADYIVTVNIPKKGASSITVTDTMPSTWNGSKHVYDKYNSKKGVKITLGSETLSSSDYSVEYTDGKASSADSIKITINKKFETSTEDRTLTIRYSTTLDSDWTKGSEHKNTVKVKIGDVEKSAVDSFSFVDKTFKKDYENSGTYWENNNQLPYYRFKLLFNVTDTSSESITINDSFDTNIFKIITNVGDTYNIGLRLMAGDSSDGLYNNVTDSSTITVSSGDITINPGKKSDNNYYSYYELHYSLGVKDEDALKKLQENALNNSGKYTITNSATYGGSSSSASTEYEYNPLMKSYSKTNDYYKASYTLTINSSKSKLNNGKSFTIGDELVVTEGLGIVSYDPTSFKITVNDTENSDIKPIFSENNKSMSITIPDESKVVITYNVYLSGKDGFKFKNSLSALDKFETSSSEATYSANTGGGASVFSFKVTKLDSVTSKPVSGATYKLQKLENKEYKDVTDNNKNVVTFTTDTNGSFNVTSENSQSTGWTINEGASYRLVETSAPSGYSINTQYKTFTVLNLNSESNTIPDDAVTNGSIIYVTDTPDSAVSLTATKTFDGNEPTREYTFTLEQDSNDTIQVNNNKQEVKNYGSSINFGSLNFTETGTYNFTIKEKEGTDSSITYDSSVYKVVVTVTGGNNGKLSVSKTITKDGTNVDDIKFNNKTAGTEDSKGKLTLTKTISGDINKDDVDKKLSFVITDPSNNSTTYTVGQDNFVFDDSTNSYKLALNNIEVGEYTIKENSLDITGKTVSTTYKVNSGDFTNGSEAKVTITAGGSGEVSFTNKYEDQSHSINISKVDIADGSKELEGAKLIVKKKNGEVVETWTSTSVAKNISLKPGDYVLIEDQAPAGYDIAEQIEFTVNQDGTLTSNNKDAVNGTTVTMRDEHTSDKHEVVISKVDATNGNELPGALLVITNRDGKEVARWTSTSETHKEKLSSGTYTLSEYTAPEGYAKAESITFTIDDNGKVTIDGKEVKEVVMKDEQLHKVNISKVSATNSKEIEGAKLKLYDVNKKVVEEWTSTTSVHTVTLEAGTYTLEETIAPKGYKVASSITFIVDDKGNITINGNKVDTVIMIDELEDDDSKEDKPKDNKPKYKVVKTSSR